MTEGEDFYSLSIANCVFNAFLSYTAIMFNIITIHALRKTTSLPKPLKTLLLSVAVSDLGVGLLVQPLYIALLVVGMEQNTNNNTSIAIYVAYVIPANVFCFASFFGVVALGADRFLAIHLHLRYQELVTHKRVVAVVVSIWVFSVFLTLIDLLVWIPENVCFFIFTTVEVVCYIATGFLCYKIYAAVRRHTNQIQALQVQQVARNGEITNAVKLKKTAVATFYVYLVFSTCYLPYICINVAYKTCCQNTLLWYLRRYASTLVFLNSSLNPLIYCWKMTHIRHAVLVILRNVFRSQN